MKQTKTTKIALVSLLTALSVVLGYFLKIPTPTGILTLLDAGVFFAAFYFGSREGAVVGGYALGSTLMNGWAAALPEILPNFMQNMVGMIVGFILSQSIKKIK